MRNIECHICNKMFSKYGIKNHIAITHEGKKERVQGNLGKIGQIAWNKGLTKETSDIIKNCAEKTSKTLTGKPGFKHTEKSRKKISKARTKYLIENPDKVPYLLNHSSKISYPEKIFKEALEKNKIDGWVFRFQNSIYQYDFAFVDLKIDIEIDGATHLTEKVKVIDKRRDKFSKKHGWKVLRFTAKEVKKDVDKCIKKLKKILALGEKVITSDS